MPPKRKSSSIDEPSNGKKAKSAAAQEASSSEAQLLDAQLQSTMKRREQRWAEVSGSKNLDNNYLMTMKDPSIAYEFNCICNPIEEEDGDDCDYGKTCPCEKPAASLPSHPYTITMAGLSKYGMASHMVNLRNPDAFAMYTFNDHLAYGVLEVVQNLLLDFDEAYKAQQWREAWAVVEGLALFMLVDQGEMMYMADDGEMIKTTTAQMARMVLAMLAILDNEGQLTNNSDTKNIGWVMALYQELATSLQDQGVLEDARPSKAKTFKFNADNLSLYLQSYASRCEITMPGVTNIPKDVNLTMPKMDAKDPWGWTSSFSKYRSGCVAPGYAFRGSHRGVIGGDGLDISTWTSAERKKHAFDKNDPLPKDAAKNLTDGFVLALAS